MSKTKKHKLQNPEINFVSSLDIETVAAEIAALHNEQMSVDIHSVDADRVLFRMHYQREGKATATVEGMLRRWAGTMTHIVCDGVARRQRPLLRKVQFYFNRLLLLWTLLIGLILFFRPVFDNSMLVSTILGTTLLASCMVLPAYLLINLVGATAGEGTYYIRDRDLMLQRLVDLLAPHRENAQSVQAAEAETLPLSELVRLAYDDELDASVFVALGEHFEDRAARQKKTSLS